MMWFGKIRKKAILDAHPVSKVFGFDRGTPIDRYYIENFLRLNSRDIHGDVLEVGEDTYSKKFSAAGSRNTIFYFDESSGGEHLKGDLTKSNALPANVADCFICTQTFNFIYDIRSAILGAHHLLKPGGVLLATVACLAPISAYDAKRWGDYWRLTPQGCQRLFGDIFSSAEIFPLGNSAAAALFMKGYAQEDLPRGFDLAANDPLFPLVIGIRSVK